MKDTKVRVLPTADTPKAAYKALKNHPSGYRMEQILYRLPAEVVSTAFWTLDHSDRRYTWKLQSIRLLHARPSFPILCWPMINMDVWNSLTEEGAGLDYRGLRVMMPQWPSAPISVKIEISFYGNGRVAGI